MESMNVTPTEVINLYNTGRRRGFIAGVVISFALYSIVKNFKGSEVLPR